MLAEMLVDTRKFDGCLGVDALSDDALAKVYAIKGRDEGKPIHAIVSSMEMARLYGDVDENAAIAAAKGFEAMDTSAIEAMVDEAIAADPDAWAKYCAGEEKAAGAIVGRVMKASKGKANPAQVNALLLQKLG